MSSMNSKAALEASKSTAQLAAVVEASEEAIITLGPKDVQVGTAAEQTKYKEQTYYFCGAKCKGKFVLKPEHYLEKSEGTTKGDHSCCG